MDKIIVWDNEQGTSVDRYTILDEEAGKAYFLSEDRYGIKFDSYLIGCINVAWMDDNNKRIEFEMLPEKIKTAWRN